MSDLAEELNIGIPYLRQTLMEKGAPKLIPDLTAGRLNLYSDDTAERWLADYRKWREEEPARKAAKRADDDARARYAREAEMTRISAEQRLMAEGQAATDAANAEEAARVRRAEGGVY
ncbi:hypothetical protein [Variovorax sp. OV084]|jgi:hypothetical protein|uniref:hypothetical protein n=1 Tax=Variovorax sp. OV084 TaxID=1882777 RepID=UPI0008B9EEF1|nr:hypothetical protein [Variovorax sp. OV084]SET78228.1 hypothetical protein SAMN05443580_106282 [Variovorax sp. OV084]